MSIPADPTTHPGTHRDRRRLSALIAAAGTALSLAAALVVGAAPAAANPALPDDPIGALEHVAAAKGGLVDLRGWAADPDTNENATVFALVDGHKAGYVETAFARPKIAKRYGTGPTPGFDFTAAVPSGVHTVCVGVRNSAAGIARVLGCRVLPKGTALNSSQLAAHNPSGKVSRVSANAKTFAVSGWSAEPDFRTGRMVAVLYVDGAPAQTVDTHHATAGQRTAGAGKRGAFDFSVPVSKGAHNGCVWIVNTGLGSNALVGCVAADTRGPAGTHKVTTPALNKNVLKEARKHLGQPYVWGAAGPKSFDCSGLVMFSYHKAGFGTPRIAQDQFTAARVIPAARAVPGDLVFYHDSVGAVYHVGIYTKPLDTIAAIDESEGVAHQHIWDPSSATYGSFTHT